MFYRGAAWLVKTITPFSPTSISNTSGGSCSSDRTSFLQASFIRPVSFKFWAKRLTAFRCSNLVDLSGSFDLSQVRSRNSFATHSSQAGSAITLLSLNPALESISTPSSIPEYLISLTVPHLAQRYVIESFLSCLIGIFPTLRVNFSAQLDVTGAWYIWPTVPSAPTFAVHGR